MAGTGDVPGLVQGHDHILSGAQRSELEGKVVPGAPTNRHVGASGRASSCHRLNPTPHPAHAQFVALAPDQHLARTHSVPMKSCGNPGWSSLDTSRSIAACSGVSENSKACSALSS